MFLEVFKVFPGQDYLLVWGKYSSLSGWSTGLQGARDRIQLRYGGEHVDIPVPQGRGVGRGGEGGGVFTVHAQIRIQLLDPCTCLVLWMKFLQGVFAHFPGKKVRGRVHTGGLELSGDFTWTQAACGVPMVPQPVLEVRSEEEFLDKWVDEFGRWLSRSEVLPGRSFLHDTSDGVVRWDERGLGWRVAVEYLPVVEMVWGCFLLNTSPFSPRWLLEEFLHREARSAHEGNPSLQTTSEVVGTSPSAPKTATALQQ